MTESADSNVMCIACGKQEADCKCDEPKTATRTQKPQHEANIFAAINAVENMLEKARTGVDRIAGIGFSVAFEDKEDDFIVLLAGRPEGVDGLVGALAKSREELIADYQRALKKDAKENPDNQS